MYKLSVCAIVKDEADYIQEFIEFHILQGVEHFFIYNNDSSDGTVLKLKPYIASGIVTLTEFHGQGVQCMAYQHCLSNYGKTSHWIAFIDCDEFLHVTRGTLVGWLNAFTDSVGAVAVHWVLYGSSGLKEKTDGLVIERFYRRQDSCDKHVKSLVRPSSVTSPGKDPHTFLLKERFSVVNERGAKLIAQYAILHNGTANLFRIAHFHTKSESEYRKRKRTSPDANSARVYTEERINEMFMAHDRNDIEDKYLTKFAETIKERISKL